MPEEDDVAMSRWARDAQNKPLKVGETQRLRLQSKHYDFVMTTLAKDRSVALLLHLTIRGQKIKARIIEVKERPWVKFEILAIEKPN